MNRLVRVAALFLALVGLVGLTAGPASAGPPVRVEGCELVVDAPSPAKDVRVPICQGGPPIQ